MNELEYTIKQNERAMAQEIKELVEEMNSLQAKIATGNFASIDSWNWTGGYVARNVARMTALLSRQHALYEALNTMRKDEE